MRVKIELWDINHEEPTTIEFPTNGSNSAPVIGDIILLKDFLETTPIGDIAYDGSPVHVNGFAVSERLWCKDSQGTFLLLRGDYL